MSRRKLKTTSAGVDSPVSIPKDDSLSRAIFAKRIFQIINGTSLSTHLRVGIFGSWGTGKSTVLNFLKFFCHEENHPVVSFNPWRFHSRKEAWEGLVANIDKGLAEWNKQYTSSIGRQQNVKKISQKTRQFAESFKNPIVDSISKLVLSPLEGLLEQTKEKISLELEKNLADKRLYIFVDDLDRAEPAILYDTLMLLNEIFDLNRCIFIVALDEKVASEILREKLGYSEGDDFLEKIINWRFELPEPSSFDWQTLLKTEVKGLKSNLNLEALESIFDYLPRNPRKFKHFLRYLGGLHISFLNRFGQEEFDWKLLYLIQLLRLEFPNEFRVVAHDSTMVNDIMSGFMSDKVRTHAGLNKQTEDEPEWILNLKKKFPHLSESNKERFISLYKAIRETSMMFNEQLLRNHLLVIENPELLTWKEYGVIKKSLLPLTGTKLLKKLKKIILRNKQLRELEVSREFFKSLMRERDVFLQKVADCDTEKEMKKGLAQVKQNMRICFILTDISEIFTGDDPIFDLNTVKEWVSFLSKWAHFKEPKLYAAVRQDEAKLAIKLVRAMKNRSSELLHILTRDLHYGSYSEPEKAFKPVHEKMLKILRKRLADDLVRRFEQIDGLKKCWPNDVLIEEKKLLFQDNIYFHNQNQYKKLAKLAKRAKENLTIQKNFIEYIRYLFYALFEGSSWISREEAEKVANKQDFIDIVWSAVIAHPLNRRSVGSLESKRVALKNKFFSGGKTLDIPEWWKIFIESEENKNKKKKK